jgi:Ala-tRNA(Pro) deacylase
MFNPHEEIIKLLKTNNIDYKETEHEPVYTSEQAAKVRGISLSQGAKSLLLKSENDFILAILPGDRKLDSKKFKGLLKIKDFRFALPEEVKNKMGCEIGACYPFGNLIGLLTYVDNSLSKNEVISFNPGVHDRSIEIKWRDFYLVVKPKMVDISEKVYGARQR